MIRLNQSGREFSSQKEVETLKEVHALEEKGYTVLQAGMRKGKHYFVMGKNETRRPSEKKREYHASNMEKIAQEQLEKGDQFMYVATIAVSLFAMGMGLAIIFLGLSAADPLQPIISRGWNLAMMGVGLGLMLLGGFELVQIVILKRREKLFSKMMGES